MYVWMQRLKGRFFPGLRPPIQDTLQGLRRNWEKMGAQDAMYAILSKSGKKGRWDVHEFMEVGRTDIARRMARLASLPVSFGRSRALDFGCGIGRLTFALAEHFQQVDGVDISEEMVAKARGLNPAPDRVHLHQSESERLPFDDSTFDFVYCHLVLQHMKTRFALSYVREFVRVLRTGGLAYFQAPSRCLPYPEQSHARLFDGRTDRAYIEMHGHPRDQVEGAVREAGGHVLAVQDDHSAGPLFESFFYLVSR